MIENVDIAMTIVHVSATCPTNTYMSNKHLKWHEAHQCSQLSPTGIEAHQKNKCSWTKKRG